MVIRCYICNAYIEEPEFDERSLALPCDDCNTVVYDSLLEFEEDEEMSVDESEEIHEEQEEELF